MKCLLEKDIYIDQIDTEHILFDDNYYPKISLISLGTNKEEEEDQLEEQYDKIKANKNRGYVCAFCEIMKDIINVEDDTEELKSVFEKCKENDEMKRPTIYKIYRKIKKIMKRSNNSDIRDSEKEEIIKYIDLLESNELTDVHKSISYDNNDDYKLRKERERYGEIIERLVKKLSDINEPDELGNTVLHQICLTGNLSLVKKFCSQEATDINAMNYSYQTILFPSIESENIELIRYLVEEVGVDICAYDNDYRTPLHIASLKGNLEIFKYLQSFNKIDLLTRDRSLKTVLHCGCQSGNIELVKYLISLDIFDIDSRYKQNNYLSICLPIRKY